MKNKLPAWIAAVCAVAASGIYYYVFTEWLPALFMLSVALYAAAAGALTAGFAKKRPLIKGLIAGAVYAAAQTLHYANNTWCGASLYSVVLPITVVP